MLAQGTTMLLAGDEFKNSQGGNNNAYCQNKATGWLQWDKADHAHINLVARLTDLRAQLTIYGVNQYVHNPWSGEPVAAGDCAVSWRCFDGSPMREEHWRDDASNGAAPLVLLWALPSELTVLALNPSASDQELVLPQAFTWRALFDSSEPTGQPSAHFSDGQGSKFHRVPAQSLCLFYAADERCASTETSA